MVYTCGKHKNGKDLSLLYTYYYLYSYTLTHAQLVIVTCSFVPEALMRPFLMILCQFSILDPLRDGKRRPDIYVHIAYTNLDRHTQTH